MLSRLKKSERGQSLVEFALILPILLLLMFGIVEFGRIYSTKLMLMHMTREGARLAVVGSSDYDVEEKVKNNSVFLERDKIVINISPLESSRTRGDEVEVYAEYPVHIYAPIISAFTGTEYNAKAKAIMRVE